MSTIPTITTKFQLLSAFSLRTLVRVKVRTDESPVFVTGVIASLEHEDGSGESFNGRIIEQASGHRVDGYFGKFK